MLKLWNKLNMFVNNRLNIEIEKYWNRGYDRKLLDQVRNVIRKSIILFALNKHKLSR